MADPAVTDILVNRFDQVYIERFGKLERTNVHFRDTEHLVRIIQRIASRVGRRVDESSPMVDARLADGSRVNATLPPVTLDSPTMSIRRFGRRRLRRDDLRQAAMFSTAMQTFLEFAVRARKNILISGGTGAGKSTFLGAVAEAIPTTERIVTIEDAAELILDQEHVVRMETRPANIEGSGQDYGPGSRDQFAAHAARSDHRGRSPWRRSLGHDAGHEHRPRRQSDDRTRQ